MVDFWQTQQTYSHIEWLVTMLISIVPNPCYWILSIFRPTSKNYHLTRIVVGWRIRCNSLLVLAFRNSGLAVTKCYWVVWMITVYSSEDSMRIWSYLLSRFLFPSRSIVLSFMCTIPKTNLPFYPNHLLTGICRHLAFFVGTINNKTYLRYKKTYI